MKLQSSLRFFFFGSLLLLLLGVPCHGLTLYDFGNPTGEEQLYLELINRARANPAAEGARLAATTDPDVLSAYSYFGVNLTLMQSEFNAIAAQPPLAPNASLTTSARGHSDWMLATATQAHNESPTNTPFTRMTAAGYSYSSAGENIYASAKSVWFGHAGFQVDWGTDSGGMQTGRGHRVNIHSANYREIGVGVTFGTNGATGPQLVTQDFGTSTANPTLGTGVTYYDLDANNFYDVGEGISGLTVNVSGASYECTTATGGGWVVPVPATATTRTVTFSGLNMNQAASLVVPASKNAKADLKLTYAPPAITSPDTATEGSLHTLAFTAVGGASAYKWNRWTAATATAENCENTTNITSSTTGTYSVLCTSLKQQGTSSFHLENPTAASQSILLSPLYYGQASPALAFQSRIRYATTAEQFKVQIKEEGSTTWQDVFSQTGTNSSGESGFTLRSAALTGMTGKAFRVRFLLNYGGGGYYQPSGDMVGWFFDAITFTGVATLGNNVSQTLTVTSGSFTPSQGSYLMSVAPVISNRDFPASYQTLTVTATIVVPATVTLGSLTATYNGSQKSATATTSPAGLTVDFTYDGSATAPTNAGSYAVTGTISSANYQGSASGTLVISKAPATVTLGSLAATYNGSPKPATATTTPAGLPVTFTYNDSATSPTNAGSYAVIATINEDNYAGSSSGSLIISKAMATVTIGNLAQTYNGTAKPVAVTTDPTGLAVTLTYNGSVTDPVNAGSYAVVATVNEANYTAGSASGTLVIGKGVANVMLSNLSATYNGTPKLATAITSPAGLAVSFTYGGSATAPANAGTYAVVATVNEANYQGSASGDLVISKASATVTLGSLTATYDGSEKSATATTTSPAGLTVDFTYNASATAPTNAGTYAVIATVNEANYQGSASGSLVISKASATVTLGSLTATYDGSEKSATATTTPAGLPVTFTYNDSATSPTNAGSYAVIATINEDNYAGSSSGSLIISKAMATVTIGNLAQTYNGTAKPVSVTTDPTGLPVMLTYNGSVTDPVTAGSYAVVATVNEANYTAGSATGTLVISKGVADVVISGLSAIYDGTPLPVSVTTVPPGLALSVTYAGQTQPPANAGTYAVEVTVNDANYEGTASGTLVISKADQTITFLSIPNQTLDQTTVPLQATASSGLTPVFSVVSGPASVSGQTLTLTGPGVVVVQAAQPGDSICNPAPPVQHTFHVFSGTFAQDFVWAKGFGGSNADTAYGIATDSAGNAMVAVDFTGTVTFGTISLTASGSSSDLALLKVAADGNVLSATRFGGANIDYAKAVTVDASDNVILAGEFLTSTLIGGITHTSAGSKDISLIKVNSSGALLWGKRFGGTLSDSVYGLATDADGNIFLTGDFSDSITFGTITLTSSGGRDGFVVKLDPSGTPLWAMNVGGTGNDTAYAVTVSPTGQILVGGSFSATANFGAFPRTSAGGTDGFAMALSSAGTVQWATRFGGSSNDSSRAVTVDVSGATCVAGNFAGTDADFGTEILVSEGADDVFVARFDVADGSFLNVKQCGGAGADAGLGLAADPFGSLYLSGSYTGTAYFDGDTLITPQGPDAFVAKLSIDGGFLWAMDGSGAANDSATSVAVNQAGHVFVAGLFAQSARIGSHDVSGGGLVDLFVAKINGPTPSFVTTPGPITVDAGDPFAIAVPAAGAGPITYQWFKDAMLLDGKTSSTLEIPVAAIGDQGVYHVVAANIYGAAQLPDVNVTVRVTVRVLTLDAPAASEENRTLEVPVYLDSDGEVTGLTFELSYDHDLLGNPAFVLGKDLDKQHSSVVVDTAAGTIRLVGSAYLSTIPAGHQEVGTFIFTTRSVPENAAAIFTLTLSSISDLNGTPLGGYTKLVGDQTPVARRTIPGDANNNGRLDVSDAAELIRLYANPVQIRSWDNFLNDLNGDSTLTEGDATRVLRVIAKLDAPPSFPAGAVPMAATTDESTPTASSKQAPANSPQRAGLIPMETGAPGAARLILTRLTGADANKVLAQIYQDDVPAGQAGLSFRVDYPASVLRIAGASSLTIPADGLPSGMSPQWNVAPANIYADQTGSVSFAAAWGSSWTFANGQAVANIVFEVRPINSGQVHFPLTLADAEAGPYNAEGPSSPFAVPGQAVTFTRSYADWALHTLGNANANPNADSDGDGFSNALEFAASTNPGDANSRLQTTAAAMTGDGYKLRWFAAYGVNYRVRWSSDLANWNDLTTSPLIGVGAEAEATDPAPPAGGRFYRVEVVPNP